MAGIVLLLVLLFALWGSMALPRLVRASRGERWWERAGFGSIDPVSQRTRWLIEQGLRPPTFREVWHGSAAEGLTILAVGVFAAAAANRGDSALAGLAVGVAFAAHAVHRVMLGREWLTRWESAAFDPIVDLVRFGKTAPSPRFARVASAVQFALGVALAAVSVAV